MMIKYIHGNSLRNDEHFQFHSEINDLISPADAEILNIKELFETYRSCYACEDESYKKIIKSALSKGLEAVDHRRDLIFGGMVRTNKAALNHFNPEIAAAARRLQVVFNTYGNLSKKPFNEETSAIYNILQELNNNYREDVLAVRLEGWVFQLSTENENFEKLVRARNNENAAKTQLTMKETRLDVDRAYASIVKRINALIVVEGEDKYAGFVNRINAFIDKYSQIVAQRQGRNAAKKEEKNEQ